MGEKLGKFEVEKRQAVENEDYDKAKLKKVQMDEYRLQVYAQLEIHDLLEVAGVSVIMQLTLSSLNLPLASSPTTSRELLSQFSTCSG